MKKVNVNTGYIAIVDDEDLELVSKYKWNLSTKGYAQAYDKTSKKTVRLHRLIMGVTDKTVIIDHINRDRLDNRKENLRLGDVKTNSYNRGSNPNTTSKYKGVHWHKGVKKWAVALQIEQTVIYGGYFKDEYLASLRYDQLAREHHKDFAYLNHPSISDYSKVDQYIKKIKHQKKSKYIGVYWHPVGKKWTARLKINHGSHKEMKHLGMFDNEMDAAKAYDDALRQNLNKRLRKAKFNF